MVWFFIAKKSLLIFKNRFLGVKLIMNINQTYVSTRRIDEYFR